MSRRSAASGSVLVASGAIGAGMFSLPVVAAGAWTFWSIAALILVWMTSLAATVLLARINMRFAPGSSFDSLVGSLLGRGWNTVNNIAVWFVLALLLYAYFSAGGSIVKHTLSWMNIDSSLPQSSLGLLFGAVIALIVWFGSTSVSLICSLLLLAMSITFSMATGGLLIQASTNNLFTYPQDSAAYVWFALPYFVTAFACAGLVPSLHKHYRGDASAVIRSLIYGTLITLAVYLLWIISNFGVLGRGEFLPIIAAGGNMGDLTSALQSQTEGSQLRLILLVFSNLAITTSFLSIALGLFDYLADRFDFANSRLGRARTALLTFAPPALLSALFPKGFILAIGYAGLVVLFSFFLIPVLMAARHKTASRTSLWLIGLFTVVVALCKLLSIFDLLPEYR